MLVQMMITRMLKKAVLLMDQLCDKFSTSPGREHKRRAAAVALNTQADRMVRRAATRDRAADIPVGTIVQMALANVDRAKLDHTSATVVVVEQVRSCHRVANQAGVYKDLVGRSYLSPVHGATTAMLGLDAVLSGWQGLPSVSIRSIAASLSPAGGQGLVHCSCKGQCQGGRCACFKAGRNCNSRCHKGSTACCNV